MFQKRKERNEVSDSPTPPSLDVYEVNTCRMSYRGDNKCVLTIQRKKERKKKQNLSTIAPPVIIVRVGNPTGLTAKRVPK